MIETIDDLIAHLATVAQLDPDLADETLLQSPGCSQEEVAYLMDQLPDLPIDYVSYIRRFALAGVTIGYFVLSPPMTGSKSIVQALIHVNGERNAFKDETSRRGLYIVGSHEGDWLCVAATHTSRPGEVWRIDVGSGPGPAFSRVANSFEQILLGAGRLDELVTQGAEGWLAVDDFLASLSPFQLDEEQLGNWREFAEPVLARA